MKFYTVRISLLTIFWPYEEGMSLLEHIRLGLLHTSEYPFRLISPRGKAFESGRGYISVICICLVIFLFGDKFAREERNGSYTLSRHDSTPHNSRKHLLHIIALIRHTQQNRQEFYLRGDRLCVVYITSATLYGNSIPPSKASIGDI